MSVVFYKSTRIVPNFNKDAVYDDKKFHLSGIKISTDNVFAHNEITILIYKVSRYRFILYYNLNMELCILEYDKYLQKKF